MKAAYIKQVGPPEGIVYGDLADPQPAAGQVLVRVKAVAVNPIDTYIRSGLVKAELPSPYIIGADLAGVVERCGPGASRFKPGTVSGGATRAWPADRGTLRNCAQSTKSGFTPRRPGSTIAPPRPRRCVGITAHVGLFNRAKLQAGEIIFVNGGTGGIGSMVVQMAKAVSAGDHDRGQRRQSRNVQRRRRRPCPRLQYRRRRCGNPPLHAIGSERVVRDVARAKLRPHRGPAGGAAGWCSWPGARPGPFFPWARFT